jgi:hypothetical protein
MTLLELGAAAHAERERRHGNRVYFALVPHEVTHLEPAAFASVGGASAVAVTVPAEAGQTTGEAEIRAIAEARLALQHVEHIAADWTRLTPYVAQVALRFGADQLTGIPPGTPKKEILRLIAEAGCEPFECDAEYRPHSVPEHPLPVLDS